MIWGVERAVLMAKGITSKTDMNPYQRSFVNNGEIPRWVPAKIRLPLVVTDLIEKPRAERAGRLRYDEDEATS